MDVEDPQFIIQHDWDYNSPKYELEQMDPGSKQKIKVNISLVFGWKNKGNQDFFGYKVLRLEIFMHNNYSEEHLKVQESRRMEDFWDKQGIMIQEETSCCNYRRSKYFMACWDIHRVRMLACLQVLLIMLLHMEGSNKRMEC